MIDIISIGDSTEDVFLKVKEAKIVCDVHGNNCLMCLLYASKIPVEEVHKLIGGNASNNALGSSKLGMKAAFYCVVGDDPTGRRIRDELKNNKVDLRYFFLDKKTSTNYSVVINIGAERTILVYHVKREYKLPKFDKAKWVYLTSMGHGCEKILPDLEKYIKKNNVKLGFNPGTHQLNYGADKLKNLLKLTEIIFLNKEEVQQFTKINSEDIKVLLKKLKALGPKIAVLTDGPKGAYCYDGKTFLKCNIFDVPVVERTGCGDSFSTAFVAAVHNGENLKEALRWGTANSASVIQFVGPHAGLLDMKGMKQYLNRFKNQKAVEF